MTEEEFKKFMKKVIGLVVVAIVIFVVIGFIVFNGFGKETSIFGSQREIDDYKKKVQEVNSREITQKGLEKLENSEEFQENEKNSETVETPVELNEQSEQPEATEENHEEE